MLTVILTSAHDLRAKITYHDTHLSQGDRYMVGIVAEGLAVELLLTSDQVRGLLADFRQGGWEAGLLPVHTTPKGEER